MLDDDPRSAGLARRFLCDFLTEAGLPHQLLGNAELCLSELVTNVLLHAGGRTEARVTLDDSLLVSVHDRGAPGPRREPGRPRPAARARPGPAPRRGADDRWGTERDATGRTVWFSIDLRT